MISDCVAPNLGVVKEAVELAPSWSRLWKIMKFVIFPSMLVLRHSVGKFSWDFDTNVDILYRYVVCSQKKYHNEFLKDL